MKRSTFAMFLSLLLIILVLDDSYAQSNRRGRLGRGRMVRDGRAMMGWKGPEIGSEVKDFELKTYEGGTFKLSDQRGKILVLEMGACT